MPWIRLRLSLPPRRAPACRAILCGDRGGTNSIKAAAGGRAGMAIGPQKPGTAPAGARDAWAAAAAARVLAAAVHRDIGWFAYGLAWAAKRDALEIVERILAPGGMRAGGGDAEMREAAEALERAAGHLEESAVGFGRSAECDRAEAIEEKRAARAYGRAAQAGRREAARRRAAGARRLMAASDRCARQSHEEAVTLLGLLAGWWGDGKAGATAATPPQPPPRRGRSGEPGPAERLSAWMARQSTSMEAVREAQAQAAAEAKKAGEVWREARNGLEHAADASKRESTAAAGAAKAAAAGQKLAPDMQEAVRAWRAAMAAAKRAVAMPAGISSPSSDASSPPPPPSRSGRKRGGGGVAA